MGLSTCQGCDTLDGRSCKQHEFIMTCYQVHWSCSKLLFLICKKNGLWCGHLKKQPLSSQPASKPDHLEDETQVSHVGNGPRLHRAFFSPQKKTSGLLGKLHLTMVLNVFLQPPHTLTLLHVSCNHRTYIFSTIISICTYKLKIKVQFCDPKSGHIGHMQTPMSQKNPFSNSGFFLNTFQLLLSRSLYLTWIKLRKVHPVMPQVQENSPLKNVPWRFLQMGERSCHVLPLLLILFSSVDGRAHAAVDRYLIPFLWTGHK